MAIVKDFLMHSLVLYRKHLHCSVSSISKEG